MGIIGGNVLGFSALSKASSAIFFFFFQTVMPNFHLQIPSCTNGVLAPMLKCICI